MAPEAPTSGIGDCAARTEWNSVAAHAGAEIPEQVAQASEAMLDVVAVDPEEQHVPEEVQQAAVQEHAGEEIDDEGAAGRKPRRTRRGRRPRAARSAARAAAIAHRCAIDTQVLLHRGSLGGGRCAPSGSETRR